MHHPGEPGDAAPPTRESLPGRLSALLREVVRAPADEEGSSWDRFLRPGAVVGRFELVREIGRGGFGVVYEARDRELGRAVAFKAVRPGRRIDQANDSLLREAEATARLAHPNLVTLYDAGRDDHGPYLILELLQGQTLAQRLGQGPLPVTEALRVAVEVARGLAHAHACGVVHRDLTPGNVYLCQDGQVKLLDLGLARVFGRRPVAGGTPSYAAPEQWRGAPEDERTDVFSLGAILFRMLAGALPAPDDGGTAARPLPLLEVPGAPALGPLVARLLEQDPVRRPRDAGEVLPALLAFQRELERAPASPSSVLVVRRRHPLRRLVALAAAGLLALLAVAELARRWLAPGAPPPSIAVLPFEDLSPQRDQTYFSDGLAEEVLNALGGLEGLRVPGRTSSFSFKGKGASLTEIGRELQVGAVLEGSVRRAGNRVRVTAQIVNVADGYSLWTQAFDGDLTDIFAVQEEIARAVVLALDVKLMGRGLPTLRDHATPSPEVYTQYLIGRQELRQMRSDGPQRAAEAFARALAIDPGYAPAWAGLAYPVYLLAGEAGSPAAIQAERRRALAAAEKAAALAPALPEALSMRGVLRGYVNYDWQGARSDLERAIALNGNDAASRGRYAALLDGMGRLPEAVRQARRAVELEPLANYWTALGTIYQSADDLAQAETAYLRQLRVTPRGLPAQVGLLRNLVLQRRPKEALELAERLPPGEYRLAGQAMAEHVLGHPAAAQAALDRLVALYAEGSAYDIAELHAFRGEPDRAFEWLERSMAQGEPGVFVNLRNDPFLRGLRGDPRFAALLHKVETAGAQPSP